MIRASILLALFTAAPAFAQAESAERRADRLRTIELNQGAGAVVSRRDRANATVRDRNRRAQENYERQRAAWRARVDACRAGDHAACAAD